MVEEWRKEQKEEWSVRVNFLELLITSPSLPSPLPTYLVIRGDFEVMLHFQRSLVLFRDRPEVIGV